MPRVLWGKKDRYGQGRKRNELLLQDKEERYIGNYLIIEIVGEYEENLSSDIAKVEKQLISINMEVVLER